MVALEDVVLFSELSADLADEKLTPLDLHVLADGVTVYCLLFLHILEL